jgi:uncharacterized damage-inducible protein DinB
MKWQQLIGDTYIETARRLELALDGLTVNDLNQQPASECNSIGWLAWHITRAQELINGWFTGEQQLWVKDNWHGRFDRAPDPDDTGWGHSSEEAAAFKSPDSGTLLEYHRAVLEKSLHYINKLTEAELERDYEGYRGTSKIHRALVAMISDNLQHVGQIAYLRGLLKGKGWSDY